MSVPKGTLLIVGGSEDKGENEPRPEKKRSEFERFAILKELISHKKKNRLEIITTASMVPEEIKKEYESVFRKIGFHNVRFISIEDRLQAQKKSFIERVKMASAILFTGGEQFRITTILGGTQIADIIKERYLKEKDFIVAGTSAGAMVLAKIMITSGVSEEVLLDKDIKTMSGLGLLDYCIIDTHFIKRGRFARLAHSVIINPGQLGIGLGEDTALLIKNGRDAECHGSGMVVIIDGKHIEHTNISGAGSEDPVFVENLIVHLLVKGCRFSLTERKLAIPAMKRHKKIS